MDQNQSAQSGKLLNPKNWNLAGLLCITLEIMIYEHMYKHIQMPVMCVHD